jgi:enoyl-CoA hydratase/carnithine racemase
LLTLNRPEHNNGWNPELEVRYFDLLGQLDENPDVRVIVVTGAGRTFCPGVDMAYLAARSRGEGPRFERRRPMSYPLTIRKPLVAAINGGCAGLGFLQALYCDIRFAAAEARIASSFVRRGMGGEFGVAFVLTRLIGAACATEVLLSGRTMGAEEARAVGIVHRVHPLDKLVPAVLEYARDLAANCSPIALGYAKQQLAHVWTQSLEEAETEALAMARDPRIHAEFAEGVASYVERRSPRFRPLPPREEWETGAG